MTAWYVCVGWVYSWSSLEWVHGSVGLGNTCRWPRLRISNLRPINHIIERLRRKLCNRIMGSQHQNCWESSLHAHILGHIYSVNRNPCNAIWDQWFTEPHTGMYGIKESQRWESVCMGVGLFMNSCLNWWGKVVLGEEILLPKMSIAEKPLFHWNKGESRETRY